MSSFQPLEGFLGQATVNRMCLVVGKGQLYCDPGLSDSSHLTRGKIACEEVPGSHQQLQAQSLDDIRPKEKIYALLILFRKRESLELVK